MGFATPIRNTPEQNIAPLCSRFHLSGAELHFQCSIKPHATAVWNILEGFSELKWAGRLMQVLTRTLLRIAEE